MHLCVDYFMHTTDIVQLLGGGQGENASLLHFVPIEIANLLRRIEQYIYFDYNAFNELISDIFI